MPLRHERSRPVSPAGPHLGEMEATMILVIMWLVIIAGGPPAAFLCRLLNWSVGV